jgi:hypothetical protein
MFDMSETPLPSAHLDLPVEEYPLILEIFNEVTGELVFEAVADGPGAIHIPGKDPEDDPRMIALTYGGATTLCFSNGETKTFLMKEE